MINQLQKNLSKTLFTIIVKSRLVMPKSNKRIK